MTRRLLWELRYRRDGYSVEAGRAKGRPDPEWFLDCPELLPGEELYIRAFWDLATERSSDGLTLGRIPWSKSRQYGIEQMGLEEDMLDPLWRIISAMDVGYLGWMKDEHDRHVRVNTPKKPRSRSGRQTRSR